MNRELVFFARLRLTLLCFHILFAMQFIEIVRDWNRVVGELGNFLRIVAFLSCGSAWRNKGDAGSYLL